MNGLWEIAASNAVVAALLAIVVFAIGRIRQRPVLVHCLWVIVLLKLVTPPIVPLRLPADWMPDYIAVTHDSSHSSTDAVNSVSPAIAFPSVPPRDLPSERSPASSEEPTLEGSEGDLLAIEVDSFMIAHGDDNSTIPSNANLTVSTGTSQPLPIAQGESPRALFAFSTISSFLALVWLAGSGIVVGMTALRIYWFRRCLRFACIAPPNIQREAGRLAKSIGLTKCPEVWVVTGKVSPMLWALGQAKVLFPAELLDSLDAKSRRALLLHELSHLRRGDHWVRILELVATVVYWWYPVLWWVRREIRVVEEECCDACVVNELPESREDYARGLVQTVGFLSQARSSLPPVASGIGGVLKMRRRLQKIMLDDQPTRLSLGCRLGVAILALVCLTVLPTLRLTRAASDEEARDQPAASSQAEANELPRSGETDQGELLTSEDIQSLFGAASLNEPTDFDPRPATLQFDPKNVRELDLSSDGRLMVAGHGSYFDQGTVRLWDVQRREEIRTWTEPRGISSVDMSNDGKLIAWAGWLTDGKGYAKIYDVDQAKIVTTLPLGTAARVRFSPDGSQIVTASRKGKLVLWDAASGKQIKELAQLEFNLQSVAYSNDGTRLVVGGGPFEERQGTPFGWFGIWDARSGEQVANVGDLPASVLGVALSSDGKYIAAARHDKLIRLHNASTGKALRDFVGHKEAVECVAFSPDGTSLISGSFDNTAKLWDVASGSEKFTVPGLARQVMGARIGPDGKTLVVAGGAGVVALWNATSKQRIAVLDPRSAEVDLPEAVLAVAYSPDGKLLASAHEDRTVRLRETSTGRVVQVLTDHDDVVSSIAFSPNGKTMATASYDNSVKLWNISQQRALVAEQMTTLAGHTNWVFSVAFSPDGQTLASGGYDKSIRLWVRNDSEFRAAGVITGHTAAVRSIAFSPDGMRLATGSSDRTIKVWNVAEKSEIATLNGHRAALRAVAYSPDGRTIASASEDRSVRLWDTQTNELRTEMTSEQGAVWSLAFSRSGRTLASGGFDSGVQLWDARSGALRSTLLSHEDAVTAIAFAPDMSALVSGSFDKTLKLWRALPPEVSVIPALAACEAHNDTVYNALFTNDGRQMITCGADRVIRIWHAQTGQLDRELNGHRGNVLALAVSADGRLLASGGYDKTVRLWNIETGEGIGILEGHTSPVRALSFSKDAAKLASGGYDQTVIIWDVANSVIGQKLVGHNQRISSLAFSPDGTKLATAASDYRNRNESGELKLWNVQSGELMSDLQGHASLINAVRFSSDGRRIASGGNDRTAKLWDVESLQLKQTITASRAIDSLVFLPGDELLATGGYGGEICVWNIADGKELGRFDGHLPDDRGKAMIMSLDCSPDGSMLLSGGQDAGGKNVKLWPLSRKANELQLTWQ